MIIASRPVGPPMHHKNVRLCGHVCIYLRHYRRAAMVAMFWLVRTTCPIVLSMLVMNVLTTGLIRPASANSVPVLRPQLDSSVPTSRDPQQWPFAWNSIWNIPIGKEAKYINAEIKASEAAGMTTDEDIVILEPDAPLVAVWPHNADWDRSKKRCESIVIDAEPLLNAVPIPSSFSTDSSKDVPEYLGITPNHSAAILMSDGVTIKQTQPFHRCGYRSDLAAVSQYPCPDDHIKTGDGIRGCHGGSGMSNLGGTIRVGELVPGGAIRHALKVNLDARHYLFFDPDNDDTPGFRWPATKSDCDPKKPVEECSYGGRVPGLEMGALLALQPDFSIDNLRTDPAKIIARAFAYYGGYVVDDTGWDVYALATEWGPRGRVIDEFEKVWGFPFDQTDGPRVTSDCLAETNNQECQWAKDMADIFTHLYIVHDNEPSSIGGPGERLTSCAPPFSDGTGAPPPESVCDSRVLTPDIEVKPLKLKFGTIKVGKNKTKRFYIYNVGKAELRVDEVSLSHPFTLVRPATPFTVPPDRRETIELNFAPTETSKVRETVVINSNDPDQPEAQVTLTGKGKARKRGK